MEQQLAADLERLEQQLASTQQSRNRLQETALLLEVSIRHYQMRRYPEAEEYARQALELARELGLRREEARALAGLGLVHQALSRYETARTYQDDSLVIAREIADSAMEIQLLSEFGDLCERQGLHSEALERYRQGLELAQRIQQRGLEVRALLAMGRIHHQMRRYEDARGELEQALEIARAAGDLHSEIDLLSSLGTIRLAERLYAEARSDFEAALALTRRLSDRFREFHVLGQLGGLQETQGLYRESRETYLERLEVGQKTSERWRETMALLDVGRLNLALQRPEEALELIERSLALARGLGNPRLEAEALDRLGMIQLNLGRRQDAVASERQALELAKEIGDRVFEARILESLGQTMLGTGQRDAAQRHWEQARTIAQQFNDLLLERQLLTDLASLKETDGRSQLALADYRQALAIARKLSDPRSEAQLLNLIGGAEALLGEYEESLRSQRRSLEIAEQLENRRMEARARASMGQVYASVEKVEQAFGHFERAREIAREEDDRALEREVMVAIGMLYLKLGRAGEASAFFETALERAREHHDELAEMTVLNALALMDFAAGRYDAAVTRFENSLARTLELGGGAADEAMARSLLGASYLAAGRVQESMAELERSSRLSRQLDSDLGQGLTLGSLGMSQLLMGDAQAAIRSLQKTVELYDAVRRRLHVEELEIGFTSSTAQMAFAPLIELLVEEGRDEAAFAYAERARARTFLNQLGNRRIDQRLTLDPDLEQRQRRLRRRWAELLGELGRERQKPFLDQDRDRRDLLTRQLEEARESYLRLRLEIQQSNPEFAGLGEVATLGLSEVQAEILDPETTLVEYFVAGSRVLAWVVDREASRQVTLDLQPEDLDNRVRYLNQLIASRGDAREASGALYETLFAPLRPHIRHRNLILIPHGVLHSLSFAALWDAGGGRYLIEDFTLRHAPSASVLPLLRERQSPDLGRALVLGNPDGSLPHAVTETRAIAGILGTEPLLGLAATETRLYAEGGQIDVLHLAAHGVYDPRRPLFSRVELAADGENDGNLELHEVYDLDLTGVNLVVLSACETALGERTVGDEVLGLVRAFLYAGSPAVVSTLWPISDSASGALMAAFYRHRRSSRAPAEALRAAQLELLGDETWQAPYFWASYVFTGDVEPK